MEFLNNYGTWILLLIIVTMTVIIFLVINRRDLTDAEREELTRYREVAEADERAGVHPTPAEQHRPAESPIQQV